MKKRRREKVAGVVGSREGGDVPASWALVLLDQEGLRRAFSKECAKEMARLERLRADWAEFETKDRPLFSQWMAQHFGRILSELREGEQAFREKMKLIEEVELLVFLGHASNHRSAYRMVLEQRAAPPEEDSDAESNPRGGETDSSEGSASFGGHGDDAEFLFREFLENNFGVYAEDLSRSDYQKMFARFKREVLGEVPPPRTRKKRGKSSSPPEAATAASSPLARLKEIYRQLVRRLHPDARATGPAGVAAIWHEVQEAYAQGDLERLERLFALSEVAAGDVGSSTSISQMKAALRDLRRSISAMYVSLKKAKNDPAWRFSKSDDHSALQTEIGEELQAELAEVEKRLSRANAMLAGWEPKQRRPKRRRGST